MPVNAIPHLLETSSSADTLDAALRSRRVQQKLIVKQDKLSSLDGCGFRSHSFTAHQYALTNHTKLYNFVYMHLPHTFKSRTCHLMLHFEGLCCEGEGDKSQLSRAIN